MSGQMQAYVLHGREDARMERFPVPEPGPGEVRLRVVAALTCGTDLKVFRRGYHAKMIQPPSVFGHEAAGVLDAVGPGVAGWRQGDRVVTANSAPCGDCFFCGVDRQELCEDLLFWNGAYAEYSLLPARIVDKNLLRMPVGLPAAAAALVEPLACAVHGVAETGITAGETVAIVGAGPLGLLLTRCAILAGARVLLIGRRRARLAVGWEMGAADVADAGETAHADSWVRARTGGYGADRVIEAAGTPEAWSTALTLARKGGTINLFGGCAAGTTITLETRQVHYDGLRLLGTFHHTPATIRAALGLLAEGAIPAELLIQQQASLEELPRLLPALARGGGPLKVAVRP